MINLTVEERFLALHRELDALNTAVKRDRQAPLRALRQAARALRQSESTEQWVQLLADAAAPMAEAICFFRLDGAELRTAAWRGVSGEPPASIPLASAAAFRQCVESKETVVCLLAPSQISEALAALVAEPGRRRVHLFPLVGRTRVLGVLCALGAAESEPHGLEVLLALAAASLELRESKGANMVAVAPAIATAPVKPPELDAAALAARQFARAEVATWILERPEAVAIGRAEGNLFGEMRVLITAARAAYAARFGTSGAVDFLHQELLERLAGGDAALLGQEYPGSLA